MSPGLRPRPAPGALPRAVGRVALALLLGAVLVGAFLLWRVAAPGPPLARSEAGAAALERWQGRWPEVEGPAAPWRAEGHAAWARGLGRTAARALERAAVVEPTDETLLWLVAVAARWPQLADLGEHERAALLEAAEARRPRPDALAGAAAWDQLARGQPAQALRVLAEREPDEPLALSARVEALRATGGEVGPAARALLAVVPDDVEGCREAARAALAAADLHEADLVVARCEAAGVQDGVLARLLGDVLDAAGEPAQACGAYLRGGATLHAAAILIQEGRCEPAAPPDLLSVATADPSPEGRLLATWAAVLTGEPDRAAAAVATLQAAGEVRGPPFQAAAAAALLLAGDPAAARTALGDLGSPPARALRARALVALGQVEAGLDELDGAVAAAPWSLDLHRARLALVARQRPASAPAAVRALLEADPVALALAGLEPDRLVPTAALSPEPWPLDALSPGERAAVATLVGADVDTAAVPDPDGLVARARLAAHLLGAAPEPEPLALAARLAALRPDDAAAAALEAVARSEAGDPAGALAALGRARALAPTAVSVGWAAVNLALDQGRAEEAREGAAALAHQHPGQPGLAALRYAVDAQARQLSTAPSPP